jgi:hypothetical protein
MAAAADGQPHSFVLVDFAAKADWIADSRLDGNGMLFG